MTTGTFYGTPNPLTGAQAAPISSVRAPSTTDLGFSIGQFWIFQPSGQLYFLANISGGLANWIPVGTGPGSVNTINGIFPAAGNINIVNQGGVGAITVTPGPSPNVGLGVNVDGVTIQIIGNQLVAVAAVPPLTLTGNIGLPQFYLANNFNIQGIAFGAIQFNSSAAGQMDVQVIPDNSTIFINSSNQLAQVNKFILLATTPAGAAPQGVSTPIPVAPINYVANNTSVLIDATIVGRRQGAPNQSVFGRFLSGYRVDGVGAVTFPPDLPDSFVQSQLGGTNPNPEFTLSTGGPNSVNFVITDNSGTGAIDWKIDIDVLILP